MRGIPQVSVVWDDRFPLYDFGAGHPFSQRGRTLAVDLLRARGFFGSPAIGGRLAGPVEPATRAQLESFHTPPYLDRVAEESGRAKPGMLDRGDTPAFPGCYEASARIVAGTLAAVREVLEGRASHAANFSGGLHHAAPGKASGFCIFNDVAVAIRGARDSGRRVAYLDIDAHHGDGVMYGFYSDGHVLDIDFHQDGRSLFPGTGFVRERGTGDGEGLKVNVPLPAGSGDEAFIPLFTRIVPPLLREFKPDLILLQSGVDGHAGDPLAHLQYTPRAYAWAVQSLHELSHELCSGRFVVVGGGGYRPSSVSRVLAQDAILLSGQRAPVPEETLPGAWRERFLASIGDPAPATWGEIPPVGPSPWTPAREAKLLGELSQAIGRTL